MSELPDPIKGFWVEQTSIINILYESGDISLAQTAQNIFAKSLVLIAASYFETQLNDIVMQTIAIRANNDPYIISFCRQKGIERQYHTWFQWETRNANKFFSLFGENVKSLVSKMMKSESQIESSIINFLYIGQARNSLVHQNFLTFPYDETADQTRERIISASQFLSFAKNVLVA